MVGPLLAVHAHPDDETLSNGALLATWAAAGGSVTVVTCTRGERGEVIGAGLAHIEGDGPALAAHRVGELAGALAALGVTDHTFLDQVPLPDDGARSVRYVDSGMAWVGVGQAGAVREPPPGGFSQVDLDEAAARLARVIVERCPEVVVGYEPGGGYGHPDHVHAHRVMQRAVELARPEHEVPVVLWTVLDEDAWRTACTALAADGGPRVAGEGQASAGDVFTAPDPAGPAPVSAVSSGAVDVRVEVAPVLDRVLAALGAHGTQVQAVSRWDGCPTAVARFALSNRVLQPLLAAETYRIARAGRITWPTGVRVVDR